MDFGNSLALGAWRDVDTLPQFFVCYFCFIWGFAYLGSATKIFTLRKFVQPSLKLHRFICVNCLPLIF
jgi:hypothetical protein